MRKLASRILLVLALLMIVTACGANSSSAPTATAPVAEPTSEPVATMPLEGTATLGQDIYPLLAANQCLSCHAIGEQGNAAVGPSLNGLAARIESYGLEQSAQEYTYEALTDPAAYLPDSCPTGQCANMMPSYADRLSEDELNAIVAFLLSLPSETP